MSEYSVSWSCVLVCCSACRYQGSVHSPYSFCLFIPAKMAEQKWQSSLSVTTVVCARLAFAGDDAPRSVLSDARHDGWYGLERRKNPAFLILQRTQGCA